ncbi:hypothetical protein [Rhodococcus marinonascens]|uniref:hypothetical protein n=1 Tax=Rhodococcus marinonascens TaxID=38311 RepID=UPI000A4FFE16|nr:hypothetical protein [Rhodococcus marinonascens]
MGLHPDFAPAFQVQGEPRALTSAGEFTGKSLDRVSRHAWRLFADWCAAADLPDLPADPVTVAMFVAEHPAAPLTQRRRVSAINTAHRCTGLPQPGHNETIRGLLNSARTARRNRIAAAAAERVPRLPTTGWPAGIFGRRDGLLLTLAAELSFEQIARLRRDEITSDGNQLVVAAAGEELRVVLPLVDAASVYRNWLEILGFLDSHPGTSLLGQYLDRGSNLGRYVGRAQQDQSPLLTPIDRWGHTPYAPTALTAQSVAALVRAHLTGRASTHPPTRRRVPPTPEQPPCPPVPDIVLDPGYYERGLRARHGAHTGLHDVTDLLDDVEERTERLLAELLDVLGDLG